MKKKLRILFSLMLVLTLVLPNIPTMAATTYKLNKTSVTITGVGKTYQLKLTAPKNTKASYTSSNKAIATVSKKGLITAKKKGNANITCKVVTGKITKYLVCKVTIKVPAKAITITNAKIDEDMNAHIIELGTTYDFAAKRISSSSKSESSDVIRFYIKDTTKATVNNKTGVVTPIKQGFTTLTVCAGATANKATSPSNTVKQEINLYISKPNVKVEECSLSSGQELTIRFSHAMNATTILDSNGNLLSCVSIGAQKNATELGTLTGKLSEDKKTLTITNSKMFSGTYDVTLNKTITSESGYPLKTYSESIVLKDTKKPTYTGCTIDETGLIVSINFSEPISITDLSPANPKKINGTYLASQSILMDKRNYKLSKDKRSILLDLTELSPVDRNSTIELTLYGIVDYANNTTNPYPLTVQIFTNTTSTSQANLVTLYRNGNSLVAQFDKAIQTPGYAIISGNYFSGIVNKENKKEVIYNISTANVSSTQTSVSVTLSGYNTYNANGGSTSITKVMTFATPASLPVVEKNSFTTNKENGITKNVLTLTFSHNVTLLQKTGMINATSNIDGVISSSTPYSFTAEAKENVVTITFTDSFAEMGIYNFTIPEKFVVDSYFNNNTSLQITATKLAGESQPLPQPSSIQIAGSNNEYIYITFDNMVDTNTAQEINNYSISGLSLESASIISNTYNSPAIVCLKVKANSIIDTAPYQVSISGIKGFRGAYTTMEPYQTMVYLGNNKTLEHKGISASASTKTLVITFSSNVSTASRVSYTASVNNKKVDIKSYHISNDTITFTFNDSITKGSTIVLKPNTDNFITDMSNKKLLNTSLSCVIG